MADLDQYTETEERIFRAALETFSKKGKDGARMQEIADRAEINKAMLHYYFRNKDTLYEKVLGFVMRRALSSFEAALHETDTFEGMLRDFIDNYVDYVRDHQPVMRLLVNEMLAGGPALQRSLRDYFEQASAAPPHVFLRRTQDAIDRGEIRAVDPAQTLITVVSACLFFFIGYPMAQLIAPEATANRDAFIEARKEHIFDLLYHGLAPRDAG